MGLVLRSILVSNPSTLVDPGGAHLPGTGGSKYSRPGSIPAKRADQIKRVGGVAEKGDRGNKRGANSRKHVRR
jgi:hypothetical protein